MPTALSANPLDLGYLGLDGVKLISLSEAKFLNSMLLKGLLSDTKYIGISKVENTCFKCCIISVAVLVESLNNSIQFE